VSAAGHTRGLPAAERSSGKFAALENAIRLLAKARELGALTWADEAAVERFSQSLRRADPAAAGPQPLFALPIVVKDNIEVRGTPTTAGTPALRDHVASNDAAVVARLRASGAAIVAKSNMHELALGATSINPAFGTVLNPFDRRYTAGGSSGGSAVAVALGMVPIALGTDTAGSCRVPAACCGIVGFRPSLDRYPFDGVVPLSLNRDVVGLLARDMEHAIAADRVLAPDRQGNRPHARRLRLGVPQQLAFAGVGGHVQAVFAAAQERLSQIEVDLIRVDLPEDPQALWPMHAAVIGFDLPRHLQTYLLRSGSDLTVPEVVAVIGDPLVKDRIAAMMQEDVAASAAGHSAGLVGMRTLKARVRRLFADHALDALFYPTMVTTAARADDTGMIDIDGEARKTGPTLLRNTLLATLAGLPSLSLPIGRAANGLPVGALIEGLPGHDADTLDIGRRLEPVLRL
jgi:indoleacetamide hydrolase